MIPFIEEIAPGRLNMFVEVNRDEDWSECTVLMPILDSNDGVTEFLSPRTELKPLAISVTCTAGDTADL